MLIWPCPKHALGPKACPAKSDQRPSPGVLLLRGTVFRFRRSAQADVRSNTTARNEFGLEKDGDVGNGSLLGSSHKQSCPVPPQSAFVFAPEIQATPFSSSSISEV